MLNVVKKFKSCCVLLLLFVLLCMPSLVCCEKKSNKVTKRRKFESEVDGTQKKFKRSEGKKPEEKENRPKFVVEKRRKFHIEVSKIKTNYVEIERKEDYKVEGCVLLKYMKKDLLFDNTCRRVCSGKARYTSLCGCAFVVYCSGSIKISGAYGKCNKKFDSMFQKRKGKYGKKTCLDSKYDKFDEKELKKLFSSKIAGTTRSSSSGKQFVGVVGELSSLLRKHSRSEIIMKKFEVNGEAIYDSETYYYIILAIMLFVSVFAVKESKPSMWINVLLISVLVVFLVYFETDYIVGAFVVVLMCYSVLDECKEKDVGLVLSVLFAQISIIMIYFIPNRAVVYVALTINFTVCGFLFKSFHVTQNPSENIRLIVCGMLVMLNILFSVERIMVCFTGSEIVFKTIVLVREICICSSRMGFAMDTNIDITAKVLYAYFSKFEFASVVRIKVLFGVVYVLVYVLRFKVFYTLLTRGLNLYRRNYTGANWLRKQYLQIVSVYDAVYDSVVRLNFNNWNSFYLSFIKLSYNLLMLLFFICTHFEFVVVVFVLTFVRFFTDGRRVMFNYETIKDLGIRFDDINSMLESSVTVKSKDEKGRNIVGSGTVDRERLITVGHLMGLKGRNIIVNDVEVKVVNKKETVASLMGNEEAVREGIVKDSLDVLTCDSILGSGMKFPPVSKEVLMDGATSVALMSLEQGKLLRTGEYSVKLPFVKYKLGTKSGDSGSGLYFVNNSVVYQGGVHSQGDGTNKGWSVGILIPEVTQSIKKEMRLERKSVIGDKHGRKIELSGSNAKLEKEEVSERVDDLPLSTPEGEKVHDYSVKDKDENKEEKVVEKIAKVRMKIKKGLNALVCVGDFRKVTKVSLNSKLRKEVYEWKLAKTCMFELASIGIKKKRVIEIITVMLERRYHEEDVKASIQFLEKELEGKSEFLGCIGLDSLIGRLR